MRTALSSNRHKISAPILVPPAWLETPAAVVRCNRMPSTVIHAFDYDADSEELTIAFKSGRIYLYFAVPEDVFAGFRDAGSRGGYFNRHIRDRYAFKELTPT